MTFGDFINASNEAVSSALPGSRPYFAIEIPGKVTGRKHRVQFGSAKFAGKVLGWKNLDKPDQVSTVLRFFSDEVHREVVKRGLGKINEPG